tara:strand:- start:14 stop:703 length:690 start_codon:yes stop_codon:yes gene_type:complete
MPKKYNIELRNYYDKSKIKLYNDKWLNLSFNKINIYKDLYDEFKKDFIWIDLDTIVTTDISYINDLSNIFIENGGIINIKNKLFKNNNIINVPRNRYIQGNFWKLNIELYKKLMVTLIILIKKKLILNFDLQDLFNYYIYIENKGELNDIYILGNNVHKNTINGLAVWSKKGNTHATLDGLNNFYIKNNKLRSKYYPNKNIDILSFTFFTLNKLYNTDKFNKLFYCNII